MNLVKNILKKIYYSPKAKLTYIITRKHKVNRFSVQGDWLYLDGKPVTEVKSSVDKTSKGKNICDYIVLHYTASSTMSSAVNTFKDPETKVSWHLTVDDTGQICQLYDFRKITWHAGKSGWKHGKNVYDGMNSVSIGIEMVNAGPLQYVNGVYMTWSKQQVPMNRVFFDASGNPWHRYTEVQMQAVSDICSVLARQYKCLDILGHNMISPGRKKDPGPAFDSILHNLRQNLARGTI